MNIQVIPKWMDDLGLPAKVHFDVVAFGVLQALDQSQNEADDPSVPEVLFGYQESAFPRGWGWILTVTFQTWWVDVVIPYPLVSVPTYHCFIWKDNCHEASLHVR